MNPVQPVQLLALHEVGRRGLSDSEKVLGVAPTDVGVLATRCQKAAGELADHLEHAEARRVSTSVSSEQIMRDQFAEDVEESDLVEVQVRGNGRDCRDVRATDDDAQPAQHRGGRLVQQAVTPGERVVHRPLPTRQVAITSAEQSEPMMQRVAHLGQRKRPSTGRHELQGQR